MFTQLLNFGQTLMTKAVSVVVASDQPSIPIRVPLIEVGTQIQRPADTPGAYSANSVISTSTTSPLVITFNSCARINAGSGYIVKARLFTNSATAMLGTQVRLHLYHTSPAAINDHAQFTLLYANAANRVGYIDFPALATAGTGSDSSMALWTDAPLAFKCASASTALYGIPEVRVVGAAPATGQYFYFFLDIEQY